MGQWDSSAGKGPCFQAWLNISKYISPPQTVLWLPRVHCGTCVPTEIHTCMHANKHAHIYTYVHVIWKKKKASVEWWGWPPRPWSSSFSSDPARWSQHSQWKQEQEASFLWYDAVKAALRILTVNITVQPLLLSVSYTHKHPPSVFKYFIPADRFFGNTRAFHHAIQLPVCMCLLLMCACILLQSSCLCSFKPTASVWLSLPWESMVPWSEVLEVRS